MSDVTSPNATELDLHRLSAAALETWRWVMAELQDRFPDRRYPRVGSIGFEEGRTAHRQLWVLQKNRQSPSQAPPSLKEWTDRSLLAAARYLAFQARPEDDR